MSSFAGYGVVTTHTSGQRELTLQQKATSLSWPQSAQRSRRKPCARMPHSRKASNSSLTDELRQIGPGSGFGLGEEARGVLLHQAVQRGLLGAVTLVVDRRAIRRPVRLLHRGLHALLMPRLWCFTVSNESGRRHGP